MNRAPASTASSTCSGRTTVPAPTRTSVSAAMRLIASAATAVRKVTSATGSPPSARAAASGTAVSSSSSTTTGTTRRLSTVAGRRAQSSAPTQRIRSTTGRLLSGRPSYCRSRTRRPRAHYAPARECGREQPPLSLSAVRRHPDGAHALGDRRAHRPARLEGGSPGGGCVRRRLVLRSRLHRRRGGRQGSAGLGSSSRSTASEQRPTSWRSSSGSRSSRSQHASMRATGSRTAPAVEPRWLTKLDRMGPIVAFAFGTFMINVVFVVDAGLRIAAADQDSSSAAARSALLFGGLDREPHRGARGVLGRSGRRRGAARDDARLDRTQQRQRDHRDARRRSASSSRSKGLVGLLA